MCRHYPSLFPASARYQEQLEGVLKQGLLYPILRIPDSVGLEWGPRICISNIFLSDTVGLWEQRLYRIPGSLYWFTTDRGYVKVKVKSLSRVWLFATLWTVTYQASPSMGFSRQEYWSGLPFSFSRRSSRPRDWTWVSHLAGRCFNFWATREAQRLC